MSDKKNVTIMGLGELGTAVFEYFHNKIEKDKSLLERLTVFSDIYILDTHNQYTRNFPDVIKIVSKEGLGGGGDIKKASDIFNAELKEKCIEIISNTKILILIAGWGGATGTAFTERLVNIANDLKVVVIVIGTTRKYQEESSLNRQENFELIYSEIKDKSAYQVINTSKIQASSSNTVGDPLMGYIAKEVWNPIYTFNFFYQKASSDLQDFIKHLNFTGGCRFIKVQGKTITSLVTKLKQNPFIMGKLGNARSVIYHLIGSSSEQDRIELWNQLYDLMAIEHEVKENKTIVSSDNFTLYATFTGINNNNNKNVILEEPEFDIDIMDEMIEVYQEAEEKKISLGLPKIQQLKVFEPEIKQWIEDQKKLLNIPPSYSQIIKWVDDKYGIQTSKSTIHSLKFLE